MQILFVDTVRRASLPANLSVFHAGAYINLLRPLRHKGYAPVAGIAEYHSRKDARFKNVTQGGKIVVALCAVNAVIDSNEADVFLWENHFTDMDKTTKIMERSC